MSSSMATSISRTPVALSGSRHAAAPRRARASKLVVSAAADSRNGVGRREAIAAALFSGVGLAAGKAAAAELMLESVADSVAEAEETIEEAVEEAVEEDGDGPVSPATSDPLVLGGAAVAVGIAVGAAAAIFQNSEESTPAAAVTSTTRASGTSGTSQASKVKELEAAKEERDDRHEAVATLRAELAKASEEVSKGAAAQGAAFECLINASREAATAEFEAQKAQMEYDEAKAAFDEASAKSGLSKMLEGLLGNISMEELESAATDAEFKTRSTSVVAREAVLADRRAWIASWRTTEALALAKLDFQAKNAELGVISALANEAERNVETSTTKLENTEVEAEGKKAAAAAAPAAKAEKSSTESKQAAGSKTPMIAKGLAANAWRGQVTAQYVAPAEPAAEPRVEERLADRRQWIASWKEQQEASPGSDTMEGRQAERRAWIAAWKERSNVVA